MSALKFYFARADSLASATTFLMVLRNRKAPKRLAGDTARQAISPEVKELRAEASALKEAVADPTLENRLLKKSKLGDGDDDI